MDSTSQEMLERILAKELDALTESDVAFLNARESYLTDGQRDKFASVLAGAPAKKSKKSE